MGWRVSTACVPGRSSVPGCDEFLLAEEAVKVVLLLWSDRRMLGPLRGGFWGCSGAVDRSFLPPFFSNAGLVLFTPSPPGINDIGLLFSTLPLASSLSVRDPSNISQNLRQHRRCESPPQLCCLANNVTGSPLTNDASSALLVDNTRPYPITSTQKWFKDYIKLCCCLRSS